MCSRANIGGQDSNGGFKTCFFVQGLSPRSIAILVIRCLSLKVALSTLLTTMGKVFAIPGFLLQRVTHLSIPDAKSSP